MNFLHPNYDRQHSGLRAVLVASGIFFAGVLVIGLARESMFAALIAGLLLILSYLLYEVVLRHVGLMLEVMRLRLAHYRGVAEPAAGHEVSELSAHEHAVFAGIVDRLQMDAGPR